MSLRHLVQLSGWVIVGRRGSGARVRLYARRAERRAAQRIYAASTRSSASRRSAISSACACVERSRHFATARRRYSPGVQPVRGERAVERGLRVVTEAARDLHQRVATFVSAERAHDLQNGPLTAPVTEPRRSSMRERSASVTRIAPRPR